MSEEVHARADARPARPVWWWFAAHGLLVTAYGVFVLATPFTDAPGYILDSGVFALVAFLGGVQLTVIGIRSRALARGWNAFVIAGLYTILASFMYLILALMHEPYGIIWGSVAFLFVLGLILLVGLRRAPVLRAWGALLGSCLMACAVILLVAWLADPDHSFDVPDAAMGIAALLYGVAVLVAALQARAQPYREA